MTFLQWTSCGLTITGLVYLSSRCRVDCRFFGYRSSPVVKSFCRSTLSLLCCLPLCRRKTYERYRSSALFRVSNCSAGVIASKVVLGLASDATCSNKILCCRVTPIADPTSIQVLNLSYHCSLVRVFWLNE
jgi:hypothetical protein